MSFDIYFKILVDDTTTEIFNNTESILSTNGNQDMVMLGIDCNLKTTISDSSNNYLDLDLPCYSITKRYDYDFKQNSGESILNRKKYAVNFKNDFLRLATDFAIIFINDFSGFPIDNYLFREISGLVSLSSLSEETSEGSWLFLAKNLNKTDINGTRGFWNTIIDVVDENHDIDKYHLTSSQISNGILDKYTWNELFEDNSTLSNITSVFQEAFDEMDELILSESSNYVIILSRIHHHIIHENRQLTSEKYNESYNEIFVEVPWYDQDANNGILAIDKLQLRNDLKAFNKIAVSHGLPILKEKTLPIIRDAAKTNAMLITNMANTMLSVRNYYKEVRSEFYNKFDLSDES